MTYYTSSVAVDPMSAPSVVSQPTSQALVLANPRYAPPPVPHHRRRMLTTERRSYDPLILLVDSGRAVQYSTSGAVTIPTGRNSYMYGGSYMQPAQYGYPQSVPVYIQPQPQQQQVMYALPSNGYSGYNGYSMPTTYSTVPTYGYGMPMTTQCVPGMGMGGTSVIIQEPSGHRRRSRRHRRYSHSGYPTYY